jgi:hypothetical protein
LGNHINHIINDINISTVPKKEKEKKMRASQHDFALEHGDPAPVLDRHCLFFWRGNLPINAINVMGQQKTKHGSMTLPFISCFITALTYIENLIYWL